MLANASGVMNVICWASWPLHNSYMPLLLMQKGNTAHEKLSWVDRLRLVSFIVHDDRCGLHNALIGTSSG